MKHPSFVIPLLALLVSCTQPVYYKVVAAVQPAEAGSVVASPALESILEGTSIEFKAIPKGDYVFTGWSGGLSGSENPKTVTITADMIVTANFVLRDYPLALSVQGEGSISEKVISVKSDYASGTVVELTAAPAAGWSFDHWEGDLLGSENPARVTVVSAKTVKAVFTKNSYAYSLRIVGPGVVDEYLVNDTKATLEHGTKVLLKAFPSEGAVFKGWSGDLTGTETEVMVDINKAMNIVAEFVGDDLLSFPLADITQPSCLLELLYDGIDVVPYVNGAGYVLLDYNRDGHLDLITTQVLYEGIQAKRKPIHFFLGDSFGSFIVDEENDSKFESVDSRKILYGDFNGDGFPDVFILGHGYDAEPWPGEYPIVLLSNGGPQYTEQRYPDLVSFFHGGATGDIDADGDLDVFITASWHGGGFFFINDGNGHFEVTRDLINQELVTSMYTAELFDIDHDGYIDLVLGGHDHEGPFKYPDDNHEYQNMPIVFWGNGKTFNHEEYVRLPKPPVPFGVALDYYFVDLNSDGVEEIIVVRTSDGANGYTPYKGWMLQVLEHIDREFKDVTDTFFSESYDSEAGFWIDRVCLQTINGSQYLMAQTTLGDNPIRLFSFSDGHFSRVQQEKFPQKKNGLSISHVQSTMEKGWGLYSAFSYPFEQGVDLSYLVDNGYCLEFYLCNTDPGLKFDIHFDTAIPHPEGGCLMYGYGPDLSSLKHDGTWERVLIPLDSIELWDDSIHNYWNRISQFVVITTSTGGTEFSVKDVRIRKILPV